ncbi:protein phosphatase 2C domain-containing protein [Bacteroides sp.]|uniref:PP2C family protein-serine/threonine phosphatase n=1 Tax=Bacteroides sp. TaxID=29523 RepID=UPI0023C74630|nr:protein phosphatase 2C domain-containing protein [Bacteroides sp.]MDE6216086.1 protein phosphatase 2C domain-containing protein [Bacteroides sp.]
MITIRQPLSFTEIGQKDNQEDYIFPSLADEETRVFIMCDGMGGHDNGEVASMTAANALGNYLSSCSAIDIPVFETGLAKAYDALDNIDTNSLKKPGTTMTCLCLNEDNYLVAHIGDSRIYHIRPSLYNFNTKRGGILYQSSDHSLVNDLLKAGELTEDEAKDFPQKNIITRAMQPHLAKRYKADVYTFDDIQGGDYFFMCSDGILERLSNEALCEILAQDNLSDELKLAKIKSICENKTKDNYTCWLIPIDKTNVKGTNSKNTQIIQAIEEGESTGLSVAEDPVPMITQQSKEKKNKYSFPKFSVDAENFNTEKLLLYIDLLVIGIMLVISLWFLIKSIV